MTWLHLWKTTRPLACVLCLTPVFVGAQTAEHPATVAPAPPGGEQTSTKSFSYVLGPDDAVRILVLEAPESSVERLVIDSEGQVTLPLTGRFEAAGLTVRGLEEEVRRRFAPFIREPHVAVSLVEARAQTVSVIGAVGKPGIHSIRGPTPLVDVLSLAGGLREDAGHRIRISRPQGEATPPFLGTAEGARVAEVEVKAIMEAGGPRQNFAILPHDVISVPRADMVYVIGAVERSGGFLLEEREQISVIQALALAGGMTGVAAPKKARILRASGDAGEKVEIPIDLKLLLEGRGSDVGLQSDDILFVPKSGGKIAARQAADAAIRIGTGIAIFAGDRR